MKFTLIDNFTYEVKKKIAGRSSKAGTIVATQIKKDTSPFVPFLTGSLDQRTKVLGNEIIYPGPYARYLYYGVKMVDASTGKGASRYIDKYGNEVYRFKKGAVLRPTREPLSYTKDSHKMAGPHWFERSKAQNLGKWIRIAKKVVDTGSE